MSTDKWGHARTSMNEWEQVQAGTSAGEHKRGVWGVWMGTGGFEREWGHAQMSGDVHEQARMSGSGYKQGQAGTSVNEQKRGVQGVWMGTRRFE